MFNIIKYDNKLFDIWDNFVNNYSLNGTFLQTRNFLEYHPKGRFKDASLMVYEGDLLVAVVPACVIENGNKKEFVSHKGSTYGGIIVRNSYYKAERLINIITTVDSYLKENFSYALLKITADIHSKQNSDLLQYVLEFCGFENYVELNTYIDMDELHENVLTSFDRNKIRNIKKCMEHNLQFRELVNNAEIEEFYKLLQINLSKYNLEPIHTVEELKDFRNNRIPKNVKFYGVFDKDKMMAAGMLFVFDNVNVVHAQNLSADYRFNEYSPITYLYYKVIEITKKEGYKALSWGISTENKGKTLNMGLIRNKESYGSKYQLNRTFYKTYE